MLDLGGASGYFSIRLTQEFGARCVVVDKDPSVLGAVGQVASVVNKAITPEGVRRLGTYDMVLGLSFLHHVPDWRGMLGMMNRVTRSTLVIETPNPKEVLRSAVNRRELGMIELEVLRVCTQRIGVSTSVWDPNVKRTLRLMRRDGLPTTGVVFSGSGNNGLHTKRFTDELTAVLGYTPYPGSLNLRTSRAFRLGAYAAEYVDAKRGRGGRRGGDYQLWHAQVDGFNGPVHVMRPGARSHGRTAIELWAPVRLKDALKVDDGDNVRLRIGA